MKPPTTTPDARAPAARQTPAAPAAAPDGDLPAAEVAAPAALVPAPACQLVENGEACGATPTVGGDPKYRYCGRHLAQIERTGGPVYRDGWA